MVVILGFYNRNGFTGGCGTRKPLKMLMAVRLSVLKSLTDGEIFVFTDVGSTIVSKQLAQYKWKLCQFGRGIPRLRK